MPIESVTEFKFLGVLIDSKGSFTIIESYESVQRVRFLMTPSPYHNAYSKMLIFSKSSLLGTSDMHLYV